MAEKGAGLLLEREVRALAKLLEPERPFAAVLGGAKISGKIDTLRSLAGRADILLVGGGMANHFVRAIGLPVGRSLLEEDKVAVAREILDVCREDGKTIALPSDFVVASSPDDGAGARTVGIDKIPADAMALDVGQKTIEQFERLLEAGEDGLLERPDGRVRKAAIRPRHDGARAADRGVERVHRRRRRRERRGGERRRRRGEVPPRLDRGRRVSRVPDARNACPGLKALE